MANRQILEQGLLYLQVSIMLCTVLGYNAVLLVLLGCYIKL